MLFLRNSKTIISDTISMLKIKRKKMNERLVKIKPSDTSLCQKSK